MAKVLDQVQTARGNQRRLELFYDIFSEKTGENYLVMKNPFQTYWACALELGYSQRKRSTSLLHAEKLFENIRLRVKLNHKKCFSLFFIFC